MSWLTACSCPGSSLVATCGSWTRALANLAATSLLYVTMLCWLGWGKVLICVGKGHEKRSHWDMAYLAMQVHFPATEGRCLEVWHCVRGRSEVELEQSYYKNIGNDQETYSGIPVVFVVDFFPLKETNSHLPLSEKSVFVTSPRGCFVFAAAECPSHAQNPLT